MKMRNKQLTDKQCENRLKKYCKSKGYDDSCSFYPNMYMSSRVVFLLEKDGEKFAIECYRGNGNIYERHSQ